VRSFDLASNGVGYSTTGGHIDDIVDQLEDFKQQIVDGEIEVPETP
jgi:basic membrane protein A